MKTLVLSDIHGNIDALRAIDEPCDQIICLGDIVDYGPSPRECLDFLDGRQVIRSLGNHDNAVAFCEDCHTPQGPLRQLSTVTREYTVDVLSEADRMWLGNAATEVNFDHGGRRVVGVHGAPSDHLYRYLAAETSEASLRREADSVDAGIILFGHTHHSFIRQVGGKTMVNVGSAGQPRDGITEACYAVIEDGEVEIRRTPYDIEAAVARTRAMPLADDIIDRLVYILENARFPRSVS